MMERNLELKEIKEAIAAGEQTLRYLQGAREALQSASNFGLADMLGFDFIGGIGKHMKIQKAKEQMEMAKSSVQSFQKELSDLTVSIDFNVNISDFLTFADFFFDGLIADWMIQSRIGDAKNQVDNGIFKIKAVLSDLYRMERNL